MEKLISPKAIWDGYDAEGREELFEEIGKALNYQRTKATIESIKLALEFERDGALLWTGDEAKLLVPGLQRAIVIITELLERKDDAPDR